MFLHEFHNRRSWEPQKPGKKKKKKSFPKNDKEMEVVRDRHKRFSLTYHRLKDTDVDNDGAGHLKPAGQKA